MKTIRLLLLALLVSASAMGQENAPRIAAELRFDGNGQFKILQITDTHVIAGDPVRIIRDMLDEKGFRETESILNEWNYNRGWDEAADIYGRKMRPTVKGAAFVGAVMCACQSEPLDMLMYYDLRPNTIWCGPWSPFIYDIRPPYWPLYYWAELADYGTQVESRCDTEDIYTCAARAEDGKVRLLVVNYHKDDSYTASCEITLQLPEGRRVSGIRLTDSRGMDRRPGVTDVITLEANSIALLEIE